MQKLESHFKLGVDYFVFSIKMATLGLRSEREKGMFASLSIALLLDFILGWLTQYWEAMFSFCLRRGHTLLRPLQVDSDERKSASSNRLFCVCANQEMLDKTPFFINSGPFQIEAYFYHPEEQTGPPDT